MFSKEKLVLEIYKTLPFIVEAKGKPHCSNVLCASALWHWQMIPNKLGFKRSNTTGFQIELI